MPSFEKCQPFSSAKYIPSYDNSENPRTIENKTEIFGNCINNRKKKRKKEIKEKKMKIRARKKLAAVPADRIYKRYLQFITKQTADFGSPPLCCILVYRFEAP